MFSFSIGNDVVDLQNDIAPVHERFTERVFSVDEKERIVCREDFWLYWAAKEAAYKMLKRIMPKLVFSPRQFVFNHLDSTVCHKGVLYPCLVTASKDYVSVICAAQKKLIESCRLQSWLSNISASCLNEGLEIRKLAKQRIAGLMGINELSINFTQDSIPAVTISGQRTNDLLAFSHHGRYLLCSYVSAAQ